MKIRNIILIILTALTMASCSTSAPDKLSYFKDLSEIEAGALMASRQYLTLQPDDELAISVSSEIPEATRHFNLSTADMSNKTNILTTNRMQQTYIVNPQGDIDFPTLGKIHVQGMTTTELKDYLVARISKTVKDPMIKVSLVNFRVNVLGEVKEPMVVERTSERLTILEALAESQDLTEYGDRSRVKVIRENADGQISFGTVDLRDSRLTSSPYYYLQQNDVVIVPPNDMRERNARLDMREANRITMINVIVAAASVITTLVINLVK